MAGDNTSVLDKIASLGTSIAGAVSPWAGMLGGLGSIGGAIGSLFGQNNQNEAYLQAVKETNEMNYKIWQEEQQFSREMNYITNQQNRKNWQDQFDATNEYNTASAQMARLRQAGLNPSLMMNGGNAGIAQSSGIAGASASTPSAPAMQAPNAQGFTNSVDVAVDNLSQALTSTADSLSKFSQSRSIDTKTPVEVTNIEADTENTNVDTEGKRIDNTWKPHTYSADYNFKSANTRLLDAQANLMENEEFISNVTLGDQIEAQRLKTTNLFLDAETKQLALCFMPAEHFAQLEVYANQCANLVAQGKMYKSQAIESIAHAADYYSNIKYRDEQRRGLKMQNDVFANSFDSRNSYEKNYWGTMANYQSAEFQTSSDYLNSYNQDRSLIQTSNEMTGSVSWANTIGHKMFNAAFTSVTLSNGQLSLDSQLQQYYQKRSWLYNGSRAFKEIGGNITSPFVGLPSFNRTTNNQYRNYNIHDNNTFNY